MNYYSIIPFIAFVSNLIIWTLVYAQPKRTPVHTSYLMLANCFTLWSFLDFLMLTPIPESWLYTILKLDPILWGSIGFLSLNFAYSLVGKKRDAIFFAALSVIPIVAATSIFTNAIYDGVIERKWGLHEKTGPLMIPMVIVSVLVPSIYAIFIAAKERSKLKNKTVKKSLDLLVIGSSTTLVLGMLSEVILPFLGEWSFPEYGPSLTLVMAFFVYQAVVRHNFLVLSAEEAGIDIFDNAADGIVIVSGTKGHTLVNKAAQHLLGLDENVVDPYEYPVMQRLLDSTIESKSETMEIAVGNDTVLVNVSNAPILHHSEAVGQLLVLKDVTEEKRFEAEKEKLEDQLRQSQKMQAIGTLAGGVAHDMNNILTGIMGFTSVLLSEMPEGNPWRKDIEHIVACAKRGKDLTSDLLGFARQGKYVRQRISLASVASDFVPLLRRIASAKVSIEGKSDGNPLDIEGDPNQINHALMNLAINASDAMPEGGILSISTDMVSLPSDELQAFSVLAPGLYGRLQVSDTGKGMSQEELQRAFEPFFTTKAPGAGTGLGLSMVYGTVKNHGGEVVLSTIPGKGTVATVVLPLMRTEPSQRELVATSEPRSLDSELGTILVVDDEELIRKSMSRMLSTMGYEVILAENGAVALELFEKSFAKIDVVLLDMAMPVMGGQECFFKLKKIDPKVKVIIVSGYARSTDTESVLANGAIGFISKPFEVGILSEYLEKATR